MNEGFSFRDNWKVILTIIGITALVTTLIISMLFGGKKPKDPDTGEPVIADPNKPTDGSKPGGRPEIVLSESQKIYSEWIEVNPDIEYVLYLDGKSIPVLRSGMKNDEFQSSYYSIVDGYEYAFVDIRFRDTSHNMIIYGHTSLEYDTIFNRFTDTAFVERNLEFYLESKEGMRHFTVVACVETGEGDTYLRWTAHQFFSDDEFRYYLKSAQERSTVTIPPVDYEEYDWGLTLVTCRLVDGWCTHKRIIIVAVPD